MGHPQCDWSAEEIKQNLNTNKSGTQPVPALICLFSASGRRVRMYHIQNRRQCIRLGHLPEGVYYLKSVNRRFGTTPVIVKE